jgi:glycine cleavage system regulatory protein
MGIHDRFREWVNVYVLGGLEVEERQEVEEHAEACGECGGLLRQAKDFASQVSGTVAPDAPPEDLEGRILDHLRGNRPQGVLERFHPALVRTARWGVAAAVLVSLIFLGDVFPRFQAGGLMGAHCDALVVREPESVSIAPDDDRHVLLDSDILQRMDTTGTGGGSYGRRWGGRVRGEGFGGSASATDHTNWPNLSSFLESRKIVRNARVEIEVDSCEIVQKKLVEIVEAAKGFSAGNDHQRLPNGKMQATVTLRIPPERFDGVLDQIRALGNVRRQTLSTQDVTKNWVDLEARLSTKEALLERLKKVLAEAKGTVKELMEAEAQVGKTIEEIESVKGELKYYENLVALATIVLEISEKDMGQPFEYVQTLQSAIAVTAPDADDAAAKAQKIVLDAGGQVVDSRMIRHDDGRTTGALSGRIDAEKFPEVREKIRALGYVTRDTVDRRRTAQGGKDGGHVGNAPVRKELAVVDLTLEAPSVVVTRTAEIKVEVAEVEKAYLASRQAVIDAGGRVEDGSLKGHDDQSSAEVKGKVAADQFPDLVAKLKALGKVVGSKIDFKDSVVPGVAGSREEAVIELSIQTPSPVIVEDHGIGRKVRDTVSNSLDGLTWSAERLFVGIGVAGPWVVLGILGWASYRFYRRRKAARAAAPGVTAP